MKHFVCNLLFFLSTSIFILNAQQCPVATPKIAVKDTFYHQYIISDDYRWLEKTQSPEVMEWVKEQDKFSQRALNKSLVKTNARRWIDQYGYYKNKNYHKDGKYFFTYGFYSSVEVPCLFYKSKYNGEFTELVNPNYISKDDVVDIKRYKVSGNSAYLAYQFNRNGSDWAEMKVVNLKNGVHLKDHLTGIKFSNIAWMGDGFFYSTFEQDHQFGETKLQKIYYHQLGQEQSEDELVFHRNNPYLFFEFKVSHDERFLIITEENEQAGVTNVFIKDYQASNPGFRPLVMNYKYGLNILEKHDGKFIAISTQENNCGVVVEIDPLNPTQWRAITHNLEKSVLLNVKPMKDVFIATYYSDRCPVMLIYKYSGEVLYKKEYEAGTSLSNLEGEFEDEAFFFEFGSYTIPPIKYKMNLETMKTELVHFAEISYFYKDIETKQVEYISEDSVAVSMTLVYEKGLKLDGNNPAILKAYGGFGSISMPRFDAGIVYFIKNGGVFAFANIRGGGDKGKQWAQDGRGDDKQNSFDDFIAGAEFLIQHKYTSANKLAITGGSNGGLVVAAAATQRPDLFKLVVPKVAPTDMLRFEKFTVGHFHKDEYGTVTDSASFLKLLDYSPYHHIKKEQNYPAMLVVTSDHDDRVPPFHSYKFVAALQSRPAQTNPVYLSVLKNAGHHGATTYSGYLQDKAEMYAFIMDYLSNE